MPTVVVQVKVVLKQTVVNSNKDSLMVRTGGELVPLPQVPKEILQLRASIQALSDLLIPKETKAYAVLLHFEQSTKPDIAKKTGN